MSQKKFFKLLDKVPRIAHLWDRNTGSMCVEAFERELRVMSSGEVAMAQFFAAVWFNDNRRYGFDIVDAAARVDPAEKDLIIEWMCDPFWP